MNMNGSVLCVCVCVCSTLLPLTPQPQDMADKYVSEARETVFTEAELQGFYGGENMSGEAAHRGDIEAMERELAAMKMQKQSKTRIVAEAAGESKDNNTSSNSKSKYHPHSV